ncbi:MAG: transcriptional repressor [Thermoflexales bacterium]|nr:transcriptional repressor [Thermoflexales bacterium]
MTTVTQRLRSQGYRFTPQRMAIVQAVLGSTDHPSAEEIYQQVSAVFPMISLATVYKTLDVLRDLGEVVELPVEGRTRYDGNPRPHVHLICEKCHAVTDWNEGTAFPVPEEAIAASGFRPHHYHMEVYGLCSRCQREDEDRADNGRGP